MVCKRIPVTQTRNVARCVPYQIPYEECVLVPQTVCPTPGCPDCQAGPANVGVLGNSYLNSDVEVLGTPPSIDNYPTMMIPKPDPVGTRSDDYEKDRDEDENPADGPVLPSAKVARRK